MRLYWMVAGIALLAACNDITEPSDSAYQEGIIVGRDLSTSFSGDRPTIWVKVAPEEECGTIFMIAAKTNLIRRGPSGKLSRAHLADLEVGASVRVWVSTPDENGSLG